MALIYKGNPERNAALVELLNREGIASLQQGSYLRIESDQRDKILPLIDEAKELVQSCFALQLMLVQYLKNEVEKRKLKSHQEERHCLFSDDRLLAEWFTHPNKARIAIEHDAELRDRPGASLFLQTPRNFQKLQEKEKSKWREEMRRHIYNNSYFVNDARALLSAELREPGANGHIGIWTCKSSTALRITTQALDLYRLHIPYVESKEWDKNGEFIINIPMTVPKGTVRDVANHQWLVPTGIRIVFEKGDNGWYANTAFPAVLEKTE